jgi:hypothetical protein
LVAWIFAHHKSGHWQTAAQTYIKTHNFWDGFSTLDWSDTIARVIEFRTFASIWYWFAVIVSWAVASHWLIGVPFDLLFRARKCPPQELADVEAIVDVNVRRFTFMSDILAPIMMGLVMFILAALLMAGFYYGSELAQGLFDLAAPLSLVGFLNMRLAFQLRDAPLRGEQLIKRLFSLRIWTQAIGMVAIFFTAMYGMYYNLDLLFAL